MREEDGALLSMTKLLVIKPSSLGDIIHGLMVAQSIREQMPDCAITWVAREIFAPLVQGCPTVDSTIVFPRTAWLTGMIQFVRVLRHESYDYVLDFQGLARSGLMTLLARGRRKIGRADAREFAGWASDEKVGLPGSGRNAHAVDVLLQFLPSLGLRPRLNGPIRLASEPLPPPHEKLAATGPIVLVPHSRRPSKNWPGFVALTDLLLQKNSGPPVVWAGQKRCEPSGTATANPRFHNLTGQTSLRQMTGLIQSAGVVVANDSGPMHIAAAVGRPLVGLFGPTPPELYGPYPLDLPTHRVLRATGGDLSRLEARTVEAELQSLWATNRRL